jgi:hypothetical protein
VKTSILYFETSCRTCGRGLFVDCDGDKYCPDCTSFRPVLVEPFVACVGHEVVEESPSLDDLLGILAEITDEKPTDDIVITRGQRVVMVLFADGTAIDRRRALSC